MSARSEIIGTGALRGFCPAPTTSTMSRAAGTSEIPFRRHAHLDDLDRLIARHVFGDENVHLALHKIVHHQFLAGELFVKMQDIDYIAVWKLEPNRCWGARRSRRIRRWLIRYVRNRRIRRLGLGALTLGHVGRFGAS